MVNTKTILPPFIISENLVL
uniref:Uncharacterized protein n=1 Tax=Anguilla anguilla TaxID=7936 RepID=A0A0E9R3K3_ANGAN